MLHLIPVPWEDGAIVPSPPDPAAELPVPQQAAESPSPTEAARHPVVSLVRPKLTCPGKKYLLLTPRSNGVRLVKPRRFVRWDLVVGPRAPGAGGCRVLDPS